LKNTPLHDFHLKHAKLAEFAGYEMPIWYSGIVEEHLAVRERAGIFDVSHMGRVRLEGPEATKFLEVLIPTTASSQPAGKSFYTLLLNQNGGIIDDLIVLKMDDGYLLVVNAANKEKDMAHMKSLSANFDVKIHDLTEQTAMIAIQGPKAKEVLQPLTSADLSQISRYSHVETTVEQSPTTITRTGYTGEDGFEIILHEGGDSDGPMVMKVWTDLADKATPCGLGARDSLRIEAGLPLYGSDIDETTNPFEADLSWVVTKGKMGYVGSEPLQPFRSGGSPQRLRRGIILEDKIPRRDFVVTGAADEPIGRVTSGTFSPILKKGIAIAYLEPTHSKIGESVQIIIRDSASPGRIVKPPFYDERVYGWKRLKEQE
jgi:aminomethyltransferase